MQIFSSFKKERGIKKDTMPLNLYLYIPPGMVKTERAADRTKWIADKVVEC